MKRLFIARFLLLTLCSSTLSFSVELNKKEKSQLAGILLVEDFFEHLVQENVHTYHWFDTNIQKRFDETYEIELLRERISRIMTFSRPRFPFNINTDVMNQYITRDKRRSLGPEKFYRFYMLAFFKAYNDLSLVAKHSILTSKEFQTYLENMDDHRILEIQTFLSQKKQALLLRADEGFFAKRWNEVVMKVLGEI